VPFFLGASFTPLTHGFGYLVPCIAFLAYALIAEAWARNRNRFFWWSLFCFSAALLAAVFSRPFRDPLSVFLFATAVAAYSAVFESWSATARNAVLEKALGHRAIQFYLGSMAALVLSIFLITLLYTFTFLGSVFIWGIGLHSVCAFVIWLKAAPPSTSLADNPRWGRYKVYMGLVPFTILLADAGFGRARVGGFFEYLVTPLLVTVIVFVWAGLAVTKLRDFLPFSVTALSAYYRHRRLFVESLSLFFFLGFFASY
jgi:hypothetical protein